VRRATLPRSDRRHQQRPDEPHEPETSAKIVDLVGEQSCAVELELLPRRSDMPSRDTLVFTIDRRLARPKA